MVTTNGETRRRGHDYTATTTTIILRLARFPLLPLACLLLCRRLCARTFGIHVRVRVHCRPSACLCFSLSLSTVSRVSRAGCLHVCAPSRVQRRTMRSASVGEREGETGEERTKDREGWNKEKEGKKRKEKERGEETRIEQRLSRKRVRGTLVYPR